MTARAGKPGAHRHGVMEAEDMTDPPFVLRPARLTLSDLNRLERERAILALAPEAGDAIDRSRAAVEALVARGAPAYGINTGVGTLSSRSISPENLEELQRRMILANAVGTGPPLSDRTVRRILVIKINTLATGHSGVRRTLLDALIALYNGDVLPCIPAKGSVGASGDLAPLAHLGAALIGEGKVRVQGEILPAEEGLVRAGLAPLRLAPKEGISLLNGTQVSTALAVGGLLAVERVFAAALVAGALSVEAALGQDGPFDPRIHEARGQRGQIEVAGALRGLLAGSGLRARAAAEGRMQDPYSLRCQPQVMGACLDQLRHAAEIVGREVNAVSDNPLVCAETGEILTGGNFHAEPVGLAADAVALALSEVGAFAERRIALLTDENHSGLPAFLADDSGLNSGFMTAQIAAAALASENKSLTHPASADSIPTTANHEDFVSMATHAARRLEEMADNAAGIIAIELLAAAQGLEFRRPDRSSESLERVVAGIRERVPPYDQDRFLAPEIEVVKALVLDGAYLDLMPPEVRLT
jgi:histidine ammonia-lyase